MSITLRDGSTTTDRRLDRIVTGHTTHLERYPLTTATTPEEPRPLLAGFNWYNNCFEPRMTRIRGNDYAILPGPTQLGRLAGGHSITFPAWPNNDLRSWWGYYDQGVEGRCVEFAALRMLSLLNRKRYDITSRWHYFQMQRRDYWPGGSYPGANPYYEGTSVDAGLQVIHRYGAIPAFWRGAPISPELAPSLVRPEEGIGTYRWITNWADARRVTGTPDWMGGIVYLQSWGKTHPWRTVMPDETGERLLREQGELAVVTDK